MNLSDIPDGLAPMQYASKICDDLGIPGKGNIQMIGEAIEAVSKNRLFRGRADAIRVAYIWLSRRVEVAQQQGQKINNLWFMNGLYNDVEKPLPEPQKITYEHFGRGYGGPDVMFAYEMYRRKIEANKGQRLPMTDALMNELLDAVDKKRGVSPAWRRSERAESLSTRELHTDSAERME